MIGTRTGRAGAALVAFLFPIALYAPSWRYGFVFDDVPLVVHNPALADARALPGYFTRDLDAAWRGSSAVESNYYRPLFLVAALGLRTACGTEPAAWHVALTLLFGLTTLLAFAVLRSHDALPGPALMGALVFAAHPAHVDSVSWVSGLQDVLAGTLGLAAWLAYRTWRRRRGALRLAVLALLYAAGLLAKESGLGLMLAVLGAEALDSSEGAAPRRRALARTLLGVTAAYLIVRVAVLGSLARPFPTAPPWPRAAASVPLALAAYMRDLLWPVNLALLSPLRPVPAVVSGATLVGLLAVATAVIIAHRCRQRPAFALGLVWFAAWLLPCLNLWAINPEWMVMDRYLFLPALALAWWLPAPRGWIRRTLGGLLLACLAGLTLVRMRAYADERSFWTRQLEVDPGSTTAWTEWGRLLQVSGDLPASRAALERALRLDAAAALPRLRLGLLELAAGNTIEAARLFAELTRTHPDYLPAWRNLPVALQRSGRATDALAAAQAAQARFPEDADVAILLATLWRDAGKRELALAVLEHARRRHPDDARLALRSAWLLTELGRMAEARALLVTTAALSRDAELRGQLEELERRLEAETHAQ